MFICTGCQKKYEVQTKFCAECGGKVEEEVQPVYACSGCGKEYPAGSKFCTECGGKITEKVQEITVTETKFICSGCQKEYPAGSKFCTECGGKIEAQEIVVKYPAGTAPVQQQAPATAAAPTASSSGNADVSALIQQIIASMEMPNTKINVEQRSANTYRISLVAQLLTQTGDIAIENNGQNARLINTSTKPSVLLWIFLVLPFTFWFMLPGFLLLLKPMFTKLMKISAFNVDAALKHPYAYLLPSQPALYPQGKSALEIARFCFPNIPQTQTDKMRFYTSGNLDSFVLQGALSNYAAGVSQDNIICMIDTTPAGLPVGSTGVVFALDKIYYNYQILKTTVSGNTNYDAVTGGMFCNAAFGSTFKYRIGLTNVNPRQVCQLGLLDEEQPGQIPESGLLLMEQLLHCLI